VNRRLEGKEHYESAHGIVMRYADLWHGNPERQGSAYLDDVIRRGTFALRPDVERYNMDSTPAKLGAKHFLELARARRAELKVEVAA
jgi:hypothetical protein